VIAINQLRWGWAQSTKPLLLEGGANAGVHHRGESKEAQHVEPHNRKDKRRIQLKENGTSASMSGSVPSSMAARLMGGGMLVGASPFADQVFGACWPAAPLKEPPPPLPMLPVALPLPPPPPAQPFMLLSPAALPFMLPARWAPPRRPTRPPSAAAAAWSARCRAE